MTMAMAERVTGPSTAVMGARAVRAARTWLTAVALLVFAMIVVGGATRLTDSGLSITEWAPIMGTIPPLTHDDWMKAFDAYRQIPEYRYQNKGMSLSEFQFIYWWEWGHRFLGRIIGVAFFVPFVVLLAMRQLTGGLIRRSLVLFALGGLQGAIGWWMVASGLVDRLDVAPYRLAVHLTLACVILTLLVTLIASLEAQDGRAGVRAASPARDRVAVAGGLGLVVFVLFQIYLGGLVAGNDAGLVYNTWPLMDGSLWPSSMWIMEPVWKNLFENHGLVQFIHRLGAYALLAYALYYALLMARRGPAVARRRTWLSFGLITSQAVVGIATLLLVVPLSLALVHQGLAAVVLAVVSWHYAKLKFAS